MLCNNSKINNWLIDMRIDDMISDNNFEQSIDYLKYAHEYMFKGILDFNGQFRRVNIRKDEKTLNGKSISYVNYIMIESCLNYDLRQQKMVDYTNLSYNKFIFNISILSSKLWRTHPFMDGNTRIVSLYIQKYLQFLGYDVSNDFFKQNWFYFRNSLVKSNYFNLNLSVKADIVPLMKFYKKALGDNEILLDVDDLYVNQLFLNDNVKSRKRTKI